MKTNPVVSHLNSIMLEFGIPLHKVMQFYADPGNKQEIRSMANIFDLKSPSDYNRCFGLMYLFSLGTRNQKYEKHFNDLVQSFCEENRVKKEYEEHFSRVKSIDEKRGKEFIFDKQEFEHDFDSNKLPLVCALIHNRPVFSIINNTVVFMEQRMAKQVYEWQQRPQENEKDFFRCYIPAATGSKGSGLSPAVKIVIEGDHPLKKGDDRINDGTLIFETDKKFHTLWIRYEFKEYYPKPPHYLNVYFKSRKEPVLIHKIVEDEEALIIGSDMEFDFYADEGFDIWIEPVEVTE